MESPISIDEKKCCICLDSIEENQCHILEECKHEFHIKCLIRTLRVRGNRCPLCRGVPLGTQPVVVPELDFGEESPQQIIGIPNPIFQLQNNIDISTVIDNSELWEEKALTLTNAPLNFGLRSLRDIWIRKKRKLNMHTNSSKNIKLNKFYAIKTKLDREVLHAYKEWRQAAFIMVDIIVRGPIPQLSTFYPLLNNNST